MARIQSRRTVSFNRTVFNAIKAEAERRGMTAAHFVETLVRKVLPRLPTTKHVSLQRAKTAVVQRSRRVHQRNTAGPTPERLDKLREQVSKRFKVPTDGQPLSVRQSLERKISKAFVDELRKRGWLLPENEGYAAGSWAAK
jgi:hypothetical protein